MIGFWKSLSRFFIQFTFCWAFEWRHPRSIIYTSSIIIIYHNALYWLLSALSRKKKSFPGQKTNESNYQFYAPYFSNNPKKRNNLCKFVLNLICLICNSIYFEDLKIYRKIEYFKQRSKFTYSITEIVLRCPQFIYITAYITPKDYTHNPQNKESPPSEVFIKMTLMHLILTVQ